MAALKSFDDEYLAGCSHCDEPLNWEWDSDDLQFTASCSCLCEYTLIPVSAERDQTEAPTSSDDDEYED